MFRIIKGTNYGISKNGKVRNMLTGYILKPSIDKYGYYKLSLSLSDNKRITHTIHRLVAQYWVKGYSKNLTVNHKDGNKLNNNANNLEWMTNKENINHAYDIGLVSTSVKIEILDTLNNKSKIFRSIQMACKELNVDAKILLPNIKISAFNKFLGRYIIKILDEKSFLNNLTSTNFGRRLKIYDLITGESKVFLSIGQLSYVTSIRNVLKMSEVELNKIGYSLKSMDDVIVKLSKNEMSINRKVYLNRKYYGSDGSFIIINFNTGSKNVVKTRKEIINCINKQLDHTMHIRNLPPIRSDNSRLYRGILTMRIYEHQTIDDIVVPKFSKKEILNSLNGRRMHEVIYYLKHKNEYLYYFNIFDLHSKIKNLDLLKNDLSNVRIKYETLQNNIDDPTYKIGIV